MTTRTRHFLQAAITIATLLGASAAAADCAYNGVWYLEGTRVGAFVCQGGQWLEG